MKEAFSSSVNRYNEEDLMMFKNLLEQKLAKAEHEKAFLLEQIESINESEGGEVDWMDDTSTNTDLEMLHAQAGRLTKNIQDIKNALLRVHNKSYGICAVTGTLIDKRRLIAVPTTTKSLEAKNAIAAAEEKAARPAPPKPPVSTERKIISRVISSPVKKVVPAEELEEEDDDDLFDDDLITNFEMEDDADDSKEEDFD